MFEEERCMGFGDCTGIKDGAFKFKEGKLEFNRAAMNNVHKYKDICPAKAISVTGCEKSVEDILAEIGKDLFFFQQSNGGITLTGGEPFAQSEWLFDLVRDLRKQKIPVSVETCLHVSWKKIEPYVPLINEFLVDLKHVDEVKFRSFTGGNLDLILTNLKLLDECHVPYRIRIPVIPGFNHSREEMERIIDHAALLQHCRKMDFIPYHRLGENKYKMLGRSYLFEGVPSVRDEELTFYMQYAKTKGFQVSLGG
jgi:pyruvate formate lyase activating enzyme